jgi:putative ABC transport system permease protein
MLIVVKERTREFGIRKALGATPGSIIGLVLQESATLTAIAGYAGLVAGVGFLELCGAAFEGSGGVLGRPQIDFNIALISLTILMLAGLFAGLVPARHAAKINPVVALRAE